VVLREDKHKADIFEALNCDLLPKIVIQEETIWQVINPVPADGPVLPG
jgi:hypothetical protein